MNNKSLYILVMVVAYCSLVVAQKKVTAFDFESPIQLKDWWVDNKEIMLSQCDRRDCDQPTGSSQCLSIKWDHVPDNRSSIWLTDIKIDTFGNQVMQKSWGDFKTNGWLSFTVNTGDADSVYFQYVIFTKDEKDKWGSHEMIGVKSKSWKTVKVKLSDLHYDNWGKGNIAAPDLNLIIPARIEIGIRSAKKNEKGNIDVRLDNIMITNYEP